MSWTQVFLGKYIPRKYVGYHSLHVKLLPFPSLNMWDFDTRPLQTTLPFTMAHTTAGERGTWNPNHYIY